MANTIRHKRGTTTPLASALVTGELAINTATGTVFTKTDAGAVVSLGGLSLADLGNGDATAGALVLEALENANAPSLTNPFATEGDLNSAVNSFSAQIGVCRAWVNFNGTGTVAIRAAMNVSSITDNGVGDYTVNFTTAMADANYAYSLAQNDYLGSAGLITQIGATPPSTTALRIKTMNNAAGVGDANMVCVSVFR